MKQSMDLRIYEFMDVSFFSLMMDLAISALPRIYGRINLWIY